MSGYRSIGTRALYMMSEMQGGFVAGAQSTYAEGLEDYGVASTSLTVGDYNRKKRSVPVSLTLRMSNGDSLVRSWDQHVDESAIEADEPILRAFCRASDEEMELLNNELVAGRELKDVEPDLFDALAVDYAIHCLPNERDGGQWLPEDEQAIVELFGLKKVI